MDKDTLVSVSARVTPETRKRLRMHALEIDKQVGEMLAEIIEEHLESVESDTADESGPRSIAQ